MGGVIDGGRGWSTFGKMVGGHFKKRGRGGKFFEKVVGGVKNFIPSPRF